MTTKDKTQNIGLDMHQASKDLVTNTRTWATQMRDASWAPLQQVAATNDALANTVMPWMEMTRTAHDKWLDLYETGTHEMIDRTFTLVDRTRQ